MDINFRHTHQHLSQIKVNESARELMRVDWVNSSESCNSHGLSTTFDRAALVFISDVHYWTTSSRRLLTCSYYATSCTENNYCAMAHAQECEEKLYKLAARKSMNLRFYSGTCISGQHLTYRS
jgi:hypothetical protein